MIERESFSGKLEKEQYIKKLIIGRVIVNKLMIKIN